YPPKVSARVDEVPVHSEAGDIAVCAGIPVSERAGSGVDGGDGGAWLTQHGREIPADVQRVITDGQSTDHAVEPRIPGQHPAGPQIHRGQTVAWQPIDRAKRAAHVD